MTLPSQAPTDTPNSAAARSFAIRLAVFYGATFLVVGSYLPYFPVWLDWRGLGKSEIAIILATPLLVRIFFTPAISFFADRHGDRRRILIGLSWSTLAVLLLLSQVSGFWAIFAISVIFSLAWTTVMPLTETIAMTGVKKAGLDYGRMRLWGSLTFIAASFFGGYAIDAFGSRAAMWLLLFAATSLAGAALFLPRPGSENGASGTDSISRRSALSDAGRFVTSPSETAPRDQARPENRIKVSDIAALVGAPLFMLFLLSASLSQATHAVYYSFGTLHWQSLGISTGTIGALWATGVIAEIILFAYSGDTIRKFGITGLILAGAVAALVRWTWTADDPSLWILFPLQTLHALSFGATHLGAIHFIGRAVPEAYSATAQGIYASFSMGIVMGGVTIATGPLYAALGGYAYSVMGIIGGFAAIGAFILYRSWDGHLILHDPASDKAGSTP